MSSDATLKRVAQLPLSRAKADYSLRDHLQFLRTTTPTEIVLGNESADFDSIVSALVYSYFRGKSQPILPVINAPRADIKLRRDVCTALSYVNISESQVYSIDDRKTTELLDRDDISITLVDHNCLAPNQTHLSPKVISVIDHHVDENLFADANPRLIESVGSCSTLIAKCCGDMEKITPAAGFLLMSAVLLDCQNMDKSAGKAKPLDEELVIQLRQTVGFSNGSDIEGLYGSLLEARKDLSGFSAEDLLRKDTKIVASGGFKTAICSALLSPDGLLQRAGSGGLVDVVHNLRNAWGVQAVLVMTAFEKDGSFTREMLIDHSDLGGILATFLFKGPNSLGLKPIEPGTSHNGFHHYSQDLGASRKVVLPVVKEFIDTNYP